MSRIIRAKTDPREISRDFRLEVVIGVTSIFEKMGGYQVDNQTEDGIQKLKYESENGSMEITANCFDRDRGYLTMGVELFGSHELWKPGSDLVRQIKEYFAQQNIQVDRNEIMTREGRQCIKGAPRSERLADFYKLRLIEE
jgi:hypothetical protein